MSNEKIISINKQKLSEKTKKILSGLIIFIVGFGIAAGTFSLIVRSTYTNPRSELESTDDYFKTIINHFECTINNESSFSKLYCIYDADIFDTSKNFSDVHGLVQYYDDTDFSNQPIEKINIYFELSGYSIDEITFQVNQKVKLSIIIFADGEVVFSHFKVKNDIQLEFDIPVQSIELYLL